MKKLLLIALAIIAIFIPVSGVLAINAPDSTTLYSCNAYQNLIETGDMCFLSYGNINYATYPSDYGANDTYLLRLFDGATELYATQLINNIYFHSGYGKFMTSMYFSAAEVTTYGLVWSDSYSAVLAPNPAITWNGTATSSNISVTWSGTGIGNRVLYIMGQLQGQWGTSLLDSGTLSDYGEDYAVTAIPYLRYFAPTIFSSYSITPYYPERTHNWTYALTLGNQWIGTWLDLTTLSGIVNIPNVWLYAGIWLIVMSAIIFAVIEAPKLITNSGVMTISTPKNPKMIMYLVVILVFFGGISGFLPWISLVLVGFVLILMLVNQLWHSKATG